MRKKVTVVGAGFVGSTAALELAEKDIADIILIDVLDGQAEGKALDLIEAAPLGRYDSNIIGLTNDYSRAEGSDVVIVTAGRPRRPGMSRDDLLSTNMTIMRSVVKEVAAAAPDSILIIVTNPLDVMCHLAFEISGFPKERVIGMAGVLDSTRFCVFIAMELDVSVENVHALVICVPVKLGVTGVKGIIGLKLNDEEMKELKVSAAAVKHVVDNMEVMLRANNK